jgi:beta-RFAP synthase
MIRVRTPSRLHFGLLSFSAATCWPNRLGEAAVPARRFGGVGLMVRGPGVCVSARPASRWSAEGELADRALGYARRFAATFPQEAGLGSLPPQHLLVEHCSPEHSGLGTGTQLGLAVAQVLASAWELPSLDAVELARRVGRGARSALGIHGFARGGFLVEAGKRAAGEIAPLVARAAFPEAWRLVLALPPWGTGRHGPAENEALARLGDQTLPAQTDALCRLVLLGMLPALAEHDLPAFSEALFDFNARNGELFAEAQGGTYASPRLAEVVAFVRSQGVRGVGQSSWGPTVFAVVADEEQARPLAGRLRDRFALGPMEVWITEASDRGATWEDRDGERD